VWAGQTWVPEIGIWYYKVRIYNPDAARGGTRFMQTVPGVGGSGSDRAPGADGDTLDQAPGQVLMQEIPA
jgi:hypothetical protein